MEINIDYKAIVEKATEKGLNDIAAKKKTDKPIVRDGEVVVDDEQKNAKDKE